MRYASSVNRPPRSSLMDESTAWLLQARADWRAAELLLTDPDEAHHCQAIAKWQQAIEKSMKGLISALHRSGRLDANFRLRHEVEPVLGSLIRLPRAAKNRTVQSHLHALLDETTRMGVRAIEDLIPRHEAGRNTEYPYPDGRGGWTHPAAHGTFAVEEIRRFRSLAHRLLHGVERIFIVINAEPRSS